MNTEHEPSLKDSVLDSIKSGRVSMTPRILFTLRFVGVVGVALAVVLTTVLIFNFIVFSLRISGNEMLLGFGSNGIRSFLWFFPWHLLAIDVALIALLQWLIRQFRFGYLIPIVHLILMLLIGSFLVGYALDRGTSFNDRVHERRHLLPPPLRGMYEQAPKPFMKGSGICKCVILAIEGDTLTVLDARDATTTLIIKVPTDSPYATTSLFSVGDMVFIAGRESNGEIQAFGITEVKERKFKR